MSDERPVWGTSAEVAKEDYGNILRVNSAPAGGCYTIFAESSAPKADKLDPAAKARLTTWLVDQRRLGVERPEITGATIDEAKRRALLTVHERADRLLKFLAEKSHSIGTQIGIPFRHDSSGNSYPTDLTYLRDQEEIGSYMLSASECIAANVGANPNELGFLIDYLRTEDRAWIQLIPNTNEIVVGAKGYARLAELETKTVDSRQAFVAMWFDNSMNNAYEKGVAAAIADAGYQPVRIDGREHNNKIDDEIVAEIRRSRFVVADFTHGGEGMRGGVYYEAGFAHGLNIPVIFNCRKDVIGDIHFDTRQYNHILWRQDQPDELRKALANRISATIGDGPLKDKS